MHRFALLLALSACVPAPPPPHLLYDVDPQSLDNPFPDVRLLTDSGLSMRPDWYRPFLMQKAQTQRVREFLRAYGESAASIRGVGNFGPTLLRPSEPVEPSSVKGTVSRLVKVGDGYEVLEPDVKVEHARDSLVGTGKEDAEIPEFLVARPSVPLPEGAEGLLVVRRGMVTRAGEMLGRSPAFEREPQSAALIREAARALSIAERDVLLVLKLRGEMASTTFEHLAQWTVERQRPSYRIPAKAIVPSGNGSAQKPVGVWSRGEADWPSMLNWLEKRSWSRPADAVGKVVIGSFTAKDLRQAGAWNPTWVESPELAPDVELELVLTVPDGPRPAGGWPVIIGGHGMAGRNTLEFGDPDSFCGDVAQLLAREGMACLGIDAPHHGHRGNELDFFAVENLTHARDNFRQMAFDQMQLSQVASALDIDADGVPDFGPIGYFGNSLGGIMGATFIRYDPRARFAVLNVPGGGLANILVSEAIRDQVGLLLVAKTGIAFQSVEYYASFPFFRVVAQLFMETADPVNLARDFPTDRAVLIQEGVGDVTVPNFTTEDLARAMGIEAADKPLSGGPIRALFRADPARYLPPSRASGFNGHDIFWVTEAEPLRRQAVRFLSSRGTEFIVE